MEHVPYASLAAAAVMLVSLSGVMFSAAALRGWVQRNLPYLATFAGGVFLLVVFRLLEETLHESTSLALAAGAILFGAAIMTALHHVLPAHHHHETDHDHSHSRIDGRRVLVSDAFHNVGDGVLLVTTFAISVPVGFAAAVGIILHELVQEVSEFFVLKESGFTTREALGFNLLSSSTIFLGVGLASFLASAESTALLFAGIAAGGFLTILVQDLVPSAIASIRKNGGAWKHGLAAALGVSLMLAVQTALPHEHERDHAASDARAAGHSAPAAREKGLAGSQALDTHECDDRAHSDEYHECHRIRPDVLAGAGLLERYEYHAYREPQYRAGGPLREYHADISENIRAHRESSSVANCRQYARFRG